MEEVHTRFSSSSAMNNTWLPYATLSQFDAWYAVRNKADKHCQYNKVEE